MLSTMNAIVVALLLLASVAPFAQASFYDTSCHAKPATPQGLARLEPIKGTNLGSFNCTGSFLNFDPATGQLTSSSSFPYFALSTLYEPSCACWVTTTDLPGLGISVAREYANALPGRTLEGTCLHFNWTELDGSVTHSTGYSHNVNLIHRDLPYLRRSDASLTAHQTLYRVPGTSNELVLVRKFNDAGLIEYMYNLVCTMVEPQII
jgi:hypothetical protein